jgi:pyruvate/2-oxoglutarate dehydrogenase complex dihydrolipoamide acyltransferase (E2) component
MEALATGTLTEIVAQEGHTVAIGDVIAYLETDG